MQQEIDKIPWFPEFRNKLLDRQLDPIITTQKLKKDQIDIRRVFRKYLFVKSY